ncbi:MAG: hypothetical protein EWV62_15295 [Microcystis aeruginosa Ma_OC_LR_19540900_S633]|nr:MAG: hypothetical protein EWV62_15295 [Microcystis aeruginosa Ma_OC_LR_19540900_S633]
MAKRRNLKKEKAERNRAYARQFRAASNRTTTRGGRGGYSSDQRQSSENECTFWANAVRPYIVDKIRYCRGAKLAPSDRLGYYSHASP